MKDKTRVVGETPTAAGQTPALPKTRECASHLWEMVLANAVIFLAGFWAERRIISVNGGGLSNPIIAGRV